MTLKVNRTRTSDFTGFLLATNIRMPINKVQLKFLSENSFIAILFELDYLKEGECLKELYIHFK